MEKRTTGCATKRIKVRNSGGIPHNGSAVALAVMEIIQKVIS